MSDVVIGAGLVGLSCAYHLVKRGRSVTVVTADEARPPASLGNAGGVAVAECLPASVPGLWRRVPGWLADPLERVGLDQIRDSLGETVVILCC